MQASSFCVVVLWASPRELDPGLHPQSSGVFAFNVKTQPAAGPPGRSETTSALLFCMEFEVTSLWVWPLPPAFSGPTGAEPSGDGVKGGAAVGDAAGGAGLRLQTPSFPYYRGESSTARQEERRQDQLLETPACSDCQPINRGRFVRAKIPVKSTVLKVSLSRPPRRA